MNIESNTNDLDFTQYKKGDIVTSANQKIEILIAKTKKFIVYLNEDYDVEWSENFNENEFAKDYGDVINRMALLETSSIVLLGSPHLLPFRRLLAESVARLLDDENSKSAYEILDQAEEYLKIRSAERARFWYLGSSFLFTAFLILFSIVYWLFKDFFIIYIGEIGFEITFVSLFGSSGALISIISRSSSIKMDALAGARAHYMESLARIAFGVVGALFISVGIKANIILGIANSNNNSMLFLILFSIAAGFSERIVPNLLRKMEKAIEEKA